MKILKTVDNNQTIHICINKYIFCKGYICQGHGTLEFRWSTLAYMRTSANFGLTNSAKARTGDYTKTNHFRQSYNPI